MAKHPESHGRSDGLLLLNPAAGQVRRIPSLADPREWERRFRKAGVQIEVRITQPAELCTAARRVLSSDSAWIIAGGGDGTVRSVAEAFVGSSKPLSVLPLGTLNHFARDLGMPSDLDAAVRAITYGELRRIDVAEVNGRIFLNTSAVGIYSQMVRERDALQPATPRRKLLAMLRASLRVLRRFPKLKTTIRLDQSDAVTCTVPLVVIGNNPYQSGWPNLGRRPHLDTGRLGVYIVRCESRLELLRCAFQTLVRRMEQIDRVDSLRAFTVSIETRRKRITVSTDGEVTHLSPPLLYRCRPRDLLVIGPPAADGVG